MDRIHKILERYGSDAAVTCDGKTAKTKVFIQPLHYNRKSYYGSIRALPGSFDSNQYLMFAPPELCLPKTCKVTVECGGTCYLVKLSGSFKLKDKLSYVWAVLTACTALSGDDYD